MESALDKSKTDLSIHRLQWCLHHSRGPKSLASMYMTIATSWVAYLGHIIEASRRSQPPLLTRWAQHFLSCRFEAGEGLGASAPYIAIY